MLQVGTFDIFCYLSLTRQHVAGQVAVHAPIVGRGVRQHPVDGPAALEDLPQQGGVALQQLLKVCDVLQKEEEGK